MSYVFAHSGQLWFVFWTLNGEKTLKIIISLTQFNPFVPNARFLYPLKASENLYVFRG